MHRYNNVSHERATILLDINMTKDVEKTERTKDKGIPLNCTGCRKFSVQMNNRTGHYPAVVVANGSFSSPASTGVTLLVLAACNKEDCKQYIDCVRDTVHIMYSLNC